MQARANEQQLVFASPTYAGLLSNTLAEAATLPDAERICASPSAKASACRHPPLCVAVVAAITCAQQHEQMLRARHCTEKPYLAGGGDAQHDLCFNCFVYVMQRQKGRDKRQGTLVGGGSRGRRDSEMPQQQAAGG
jgi:hypothetical protein